MRRSRGWRREAFFDFKLHLVPTRLFEVHVVLFQPDLGGIPHLPGLRRRVVLVPRAVIPNVGRSVGTHANLVVGIFLLYGRVHLVIQNTAALLLLYLDERTLLKPGYGTNSDGSQCQHCKATKDFPSAHASYQYKAAEQAYLFNK